ncbi:Ca2+-transporting ATPase [Caulobacter ginsengisoli]|uniref:Ca2+-transporting ATPase n=1 Tax=Caulobacter ginsengisoli TaxID=400775 RepID=A0ABU0IRJ9_9CAUL|nr:cation-translocating P-type ATPase [Caulobacter ginsengisoli]MDQ0463634.1 Ca2+-transporting ATPase [Caulobacter ginsengisoli]
MTGAGLTGLSETEAAARLAADGPNALPRPPGRNLVRILLETAREPMFLLLLGATGLYLLLGDLGEGLFLAAGAMAAVGLVVLQEARSERALAALRDLAQPNARVIREGEARSLPADRLVRGDLLLVGEGERMPADALLVAGEMLSVDESALTGESAPALKRLATPGEVFSDEPVPEGQADPRLFAGVLVVRGQGVARVARTGPRSALGRIGGSLANLAEAPTPLQKTAGRLVVVLGGLALAFCLVVAVAYGLQRHDWVGGALAGVTLAIGLIPEEFPMVLAVFLALGAWRLAAHKVLVRRSAVIEALGGASALCVDKTGTLTENRMQVARLWTAAGDMDLIGGEPGPAGLDLLALAARASAVQPVDPMDRAIRRRLRDGADPAPTELAPERVWPLHAGRLAVIQVWRGPGETRLAAAKGAPEAIFALCGLDAARIAQMHAVIETYAEQGLRVLGVASSRRDGPFDEEPAAGCFEFAGLVGFLDPVRADAPAALAEAKAAGIAVFMITGDHPATALAVARRCGLDVSDGVVLGETLAALPFPSLCERLRRARVFARVAPEQKLLIVEALQADGHVVAMTGDGINDAPALQAADIGVAMGRKGTDVAREAADLVLLDDSFASIVGGVRLGRRIFTNLRRALTYVTAIHVPIAGLALAPILLGLPPMLFPMHVVLMELAIDPTCALVFEAEPSERDAMRRPPRRPDETLFGLPQLAAALVQGAGVLAIVLGLYVWALGGYPQAQARGAAFLALVLGNLVLALTDATAGQGRLFAPQHRTYWLISAGVGAILLLVFALPPLAAVFRVAPLDGPLAGLALAAALVGGGWFAVAQQLPRLAGWRPTA